VSERYVLDASAIVQFVEDRQSAERVEQLFRDSLRNCTPWLMSVLNWGEVFYHSWQLPGKESAKKALAGLARLPSNWFPSIFRKPFEPGEIKAIHKILYVDCVAAALAMLDGATLVTSDRDFEKLGRSCSILWIARR
jgi:predicted nucleic acid-binding protein